MEFFKFEKNKLVLNHEGILLIPEFKRVWESDKSRDKKEAYKIFTYAFLVKSWKSPYSEHSEEDRESQAREIAELTKNQINSEDLQNVLTKYDYINDSHLLIKLARSANKAIEEIIVFFNEIDFTAKVESGSAKGQMLYKVGDVTKAIKDLPQLIDTKRDLDRKIKEMMDDNPSNLRDGQRAESRFH